jgi:transposase
MDVVAAYEAVGTYRGAAQVCGVDPKTVKRTIAKRDAGALDEERASRAAVVRNTDVVADLVADRVAETRARITAKRLLPVAKAAGFRGSARNFRRLVAEKKRAWRAEQGRREHRPGVWLPGETLVIDWGTIGSLHVFCAVLAWSRVRFVRFARDETAATTLALLAECFEMLGGVPAKVLADRMGCLKSGVVANVVIPTGTYVRFATHYGFSPDFCQAHDPTSKGIVESLVGYAKSDLVVPADAWDGNIAAANAAATAWCAQVNAAQHSEICAVPGERLVDEQALLRPLPAARPRIGRVERRKVDRLSTVRIASARYSVPSRLVGTLVEVVTHDDVVRVFDAAGELVAEHDQQAPGGTSIRDEHYSSPRRLPQRAPRPRTQTEHTFLDLGEVAEQFVRGGAAAGVATLARELDVIVNELIPAHGPDAVLKAMARAVRYGRYRADDVRSILAIGPAVIEPAPVGEDLNVVDLPAAEVRSFDAYRIEGLADTPQARATARYGSRSCAAPVAARCSAS